MENYPQSLNLKRCNKCNLEKETKLFPLDKSKKYGVGNVCNKCREKKPINVSKKCNFCNETFIVSGRKKHSIYCSLECVSLNKKKYKTEYDLKNRASINERIKIYRTKRSNDPILRLSKSLRERTRTAFKSNYWRKHGKNEEYLGCTYKEFKDYIFSLKESWMTLENYGLYNGQKNYGWDIDHIIPISSAKTKEELISLCHYKNLKPLCSYENRVLKRDRYGKLPTQK
jgi:hypothetical protein